MTILPLADAITDLFFISRSRMINVSLLVLSCLASIVQLLFFLQHIVSIGAVPRLLVPVPRALFFDSYHVFYKVVITSVLSTPWLIINSPLLIGWLFVGWLLYLCKLMPVGKVERLWLLVWTGKDYKNLPFINPRFANATVLLKILFESIPQFIIQTINNSYLDNWTPLCKISVSMSILSMISGLYRLAYSRIYTKG